MEANQTKRPACARLMERMMPDPRSRRMIFCINPGRSGSGFLAELLDTSPDVNAYHEPAPNMTGVHLEAINKSPLEASYGQRSIKADAIRKRLFLSRKIYCETSHMFIKTYYDVVLANFSNVEVILLERNLLKVLHSFVRLGYFSDRNKNWPNWMSSPNAATAAIRAIKPDGEMDQVDLCIGYLLDMEARKAEFVKANPSLKYHRVDIDSLNSRDPINELFQALGIRTSRKTFTLAGTRSNSKTHVKETPDLSKDYLEHRLRNHIAAMRRMGTEIPQSTNRSIS